MEEEREAARRWWQLSRKTITSVWLNTAMLFERTDEVVLPAIYKFVAASFDATLTQLGILTLARALAQALFSPIGGMLGAPPGSSLPCSFKSYLDFNRHIYIHPYVPIPICVYVSLTHMLISICKYMWIHTQSLSWPIREISFTFTTGACENTAPFDVFTRLPTPLLRPIHQRSFAPPPTPRSGLSIISGAASVQAYPTGEQLYLESGLDRRWLKEGRRVV